MYIFIAFSCPPHYSTLRLLPTFKLWITCTKQYQLIVPVPVFSPSKYMTTSRITSSNVNAYTVLTHILCVYVHECRQEREVREQLEELVSVFYLVWHRVSSCLPVHTPVSDLWTPRDYLSLCHPLHHGRAEITHMHYCASLSHGFISQAHTQIKKKNC